MSSGLLPPPMQTTNLWCLLEGEAEPFKVMADVRQDIHDLKKLVQGEKAALRSVDASDIVLWKLVNPIEITPVETLSNRLPRFPSEFFVNLRQPTHTISSYFSQGVPKDCLHIFVRRADPPPARKRNLDGINSDEEMGKRHKADSSIVDDGPCYANFGFRPLRHGKTLRFYEQFWGVPLPQEHISLKNSIHDPNDEENDEENGDDVLPATPPPIIDTDWPRLLIRAEYLRIYKWVEEMYPVGKVYRPSAIVVTGQPGIGKSFWAYYVLRRRLGEKSVSLWCQGSEYYLFCSEGVFVVPATFPFREFNGPPVWTIIDSAQSPSGIPSTLTRFESGVFPIYITSPKPGRWSGITQSWTFHQVIMNPWTRAEIEYAIKFLFSNQKLHDVLVRYDSLGPTARFCFELTSDEVTGHNSDRDNAINETSPDLLKKFFSDSSRLSLDALSHKICLIRRRPGPALGDRRITTDLISVTVEQRVVQRLEEFSDDQLLDMWNNFLKFGDARGMTGPIFEVFVHRRFRTRVYLDATPMFRSNRANFRWHASFSTKRPHSATVHGVAQQDFSLQVDVGNTFVYDTTMTLSIRPDVYYVPRSGQQVALDSFILHGGYLNVFQCTGGKDHDIKGGLYDFLASCSGLPPRTNWRFVFVVPDDLVSFSCPASSHPVVKDLGLYTARIPMSRA